MTARRLRRVALALGAAWASWWVFFATAESIASQQYGGAIVVIVEMFGTLVIAWKWPRIGSVLFLLACAASIAMFTPMWIRRFNPVQVLILFAMMPLPPLAAGILLLLSTRHRGARSFVASSC